LTSILSFRLWVAEITYVPTWAGFLYLAIVLDGLEPARDRRPNASRVSHQAGLARWVTPEQRGRRRHVAILLPPKRLVKERSQSTGRVVRIEVSVRRPSGARLDEQPNLQRGFRKLNGVRGTLDDWGALRRCDCSFCASMVGAGAVSWGEVSAPGASDSSSAGRHHGRHQ